MDVNRARKGILLLPPLLSLHITLQTKHATINPLARRHLYATMKPQVRAMLSNRSIQSSSRVSPQTSLHA